MPSKGSQANSTGGHRTVERNIYQEVRIEGIVRLEVQVHPFKPVTQAVDVADIAIASTGLRANASSC
jgi:hypothetical protein